MQHICPPNHSANLKTEFLITYYTFISPQKLLSYEIGIFSPLDIKAGFPTEILYIPQQVPSHKLHIWHQGSIV